MISYWEILFCLIIVTINTSIKMWDSIQSKPVKEYLFRKLKQPRGV